MANFGGQICRSLEELENIFWSKVAIKEPDDCWEYRGSKRRDYGHFDDWMAHRFAWKAYYKKKIPKEKYILHKCDNPLCCNPKHLYCGTQVDNMKDMWTRNRSNRNPKKTAISMTTVSAETVLAIRKLKETKFRYSLRRVGRLFNVRHKLVSRIWNSDRIPCKEGYFV